MIKIFEKKNITGRRSQEFWFKAQKVIPGGVNSPIRAMDLIGLIPPFIRSGRGCRIEDIDGNHYIDYVCSWGALILGHTYSEILTSITKTAECGTSFGAPTEAEVRLSEKICEIIPSLEQVRLVNSGTEATMSALRLARAYTNRDLVIKFAGCYHGHSDSFLTLNESDSITLGKPSCPGIPINVANLTLTLVYNNLELVEKCFLKFPEQIAAIIVEPVASNMGVIEPKINFLNGLRKLCNKNGTILIFDEVVTGFRVALGGAQERYSIIPDLTTLGKIIGGGLPIGAYGGRREIMEKVAPAGPVYQGGTFSGNPLAATVGLKTLEILQNPDTYKKLEKISSSLYEGIGELLKIHNVPHFGQRVGAMFTYFFTYGPVIDWRSAMKSDLNLFSKFYQAILKRGIYFAPSQWEANMISLAHDQGVVEQTLDAIDEALKEN